MLAAPPSAFASSPSSSAPSSSKPSSSSSRERSSSPGNPMSRSSSSSSPSSSSSSRPPPAYRSYASSREKPAPTPRSKSPSSPSSSSSGSSIPAGRPHRQARVFSSALRAASSPSRYADHRGSDSSFSRTYVLAAARRRAETPSVSSPVSSPSVSVSSSSSLEGTRPGAVSNFLRTNCSDSASASGSASSAGDPVSPAATPASALPSLVTCPRFPARAGPRAVSTARGACVTSPTTSQPPASSRSKRCASNEGWPHSRTSRHIRSTWWCRKLLNGYRRNRLMQTGSAPDATISSATDSLRVLTSVATRSTTLTRFSPRGGVISPHGVFCAEASPARSRNAASRGSARAHAATAAGGARRGSGGASPVSAARNACIACAGPAARFASRTATATSTTFTRGDAAAPECAVAGRGGVVLASSTSFAPEDPSRRDPYIAALSFDETRSSPSREEFTKSVGGGQTVRQRARRAPRDAHQHLRRVRAPLRGVRRIKQPVRV